jgi:hypothetical protein
MNQYMKVVYQNYVILYLYDCTYNKMMPKTNIYVFTSVQMIVYSLIKGMGHKKIKQTLYVILYPQRI